MIELPTTFIADLTASANTQIGEFSPILILVLGIVLALFILRAMIGFFR